MSRAPEPVVDAELAAEHGLSAVEYQQLCDRLGRTPSYTELGIVSVMWSEHCSYKSSRVHLGALPTTGPQVILGPGENAGVVDIGDGQAVVFKMESHNHPSYLEPYQGAATGVGGICRDVFTMGARPIALADCLRFGRPDHPRTQYLLGGVVHGIGGYGNSFGVPNVAGDVNFDASYDGNILVNAFCLGLARADRIFKGTAAGVGNPLIYVGAKTGRDGIHGATMASAEFGEDSEQKRPAVQVGDPFMEKLLLEACLELMESDCLVGIQDMGAAGLTSSSVEMAARAGSGVNIDLDRVPQRETEMTPYELLLSESQERMLMVVHAGREDEAIAVFEKWDLDAVVVGRVTETGRVVARAHGEVYADLPADFLAEGLKYDRPAERPAYLDEVATLDVDAMPVPDDLGAAALKLLAAPNVASKEWVIRQYDHNVRHGTVIRPGSADAGVVRVFAPDGRAKGVAIAAGCQSRMVYLDPYEGARLVIAEMYANLVAVGARPLAITDCLNFGNPEKPGIMWQFIEAVRGLGDACRALNTPVVSGNVSFYNETDGQAIKPTPMIAMVGLLDDVSAHLGCGFARDGQVIATVGRVGGVLDGSEYADVIGGQQRGRPAPLDIEAHKPVFDAMLALNGARALSSAHDVSEGGLLVAVAESMLGASRPMGAKIDLPKNGDRPDALLFGEAPARFVVSYPREKADVVARIAAEHGAPLTPIGETGGPSLEVAINGAPALSLPLEQVHQAWTHGFHDIAE